MRDTNSRSFGMKAYTIFRMLIMPFMLSPEETYVVALSIKMLKLPSVSKKGERNTMEIMKRHNIDSPHLLSLRINTQKKIGNIFIETATARQIWDR